MRDPREEQVAVLMRAFADEGVRVLGSLPQETHEAILMAAYATIIAWMLSCYEDAMTDDFIEGLLRPAVKRMRHQREIERQLQ